MINRCISIDFGLIENIACYMGNTFVYIYIQPVGDRRDMAWLIISECKGRICFCFLFLFKNQLEKRGSPLGM